MKCNLWDVLFIDFPFPDRSGRETRGERPAVVLQSRDIDSYPTIIVAPITETDYSKKFKHCYNIVPTAKNGLRKQSWVLIFQLRAIDKQRIIRKSGELEKYYHNKLQKALNALLPFNKDLNKKDSE